MARSNLQAAVHSQANPQVFVHAYERSCERYGAIRSSLGEPDPFRLAYRTDIKAFAEGCIQEDAQDRFRAVVETERSGLHEGNFARYRVRPSEFAAWRQAGNPGGSGVTSNK